MDSGPSPCSETELTTGPSSGNFKGEQSRMDDSVMAE